MGDDDERRTAALGEAVADLSWRGDWTAPDMRCESGCSWSLMAATTGGTPTATPPPPPKIQVFEYKTGYDGPVELPTLEFLNIHDLLTELPRWQQAVNDWLVDVSPWLIRHKDDNGTIVGEKYLEQPGSYLVFARGVFVSAPGLGKTPTP